MEKRTLIPRKELEVDGKITYKESLQSWSLIRLKKELLFEFPQLKEKRSKFSYKMVYYRNIEDLEKTIKELKKQKDAALPVLMWLYKDV